MNPETSATMVDPVKFAQQVLGARLWAKQKQIAHALYRHRRVAVRGAHATGKSFVAAVVALHFLARYDDARVLVISPGWLQTRSVLFSEIHALIQGARARLPFEAANQTELRFGPKNLLLGLSTNESTRLQGHHAAHILLIIDEAPGIPAEFWPSLEGVLASGDAHLLALGNPTQVGGPFFDAFGRNAALWQTFTLSAFDTPNLRGVSLEQLLAMSDDDLAHNPWPQLATRQWTRDRYEEWFNGGVENSPLWQSRVLGVFPSSSSNALIPWHHLEAARRVAQPDRSARRVAGVDVAGAGRDRTVCTLVQGGAILETATFTSALPFEEVADFLQRADSQRAQIDSIGLGYEWPSRLRNRGIRAEGVNVATSSDDKYRERFANRKAQRFWALRSAFMSGAVSGLSEEAQAELAALSYAIDAKGRIVIDDKAAVKSAIGRSPDLAEALMLSSLGDARWLDAARGPRQPWDYTPAKPKDFSRLFRDAGRSSPHGDTARRAEAEEDGEGMRLQLRGGGRRGVRWLS